MLKILNFSSDHCLWSKGWGDDGFLFRFWRLFIGFRIKGYRNIRFHYDTTWNRQYKHFSLKVFFIMHFVFKKIERKEFLYGRIRTIGYCMKLGGEILYFLIL